MANKKTSKKQNKSVSGIKTDYGWFDTENARLIILCALFGVFGAHKFAQGKTGQGVCFILLDLTLVGFLVSLIWAFFNLVFLTIKKDNKPGNMILGALFLLVSCHSFGMIGGGVAREIKTDGSEFVSFEKLECVGVDGERFGVAVKFGKTTAEITMDSGKRINLSKKLYTDKLKIYETEVSNETSGRSDRTTLAIRGNMDIADNVNFDIYGEEQVVYKDAESYTRKFVYKCFRK